MSVFLETHTHTERFYFTFGALLASISWRLMLTITNDPKPALSLIADMAFCPQLDEFSSIKWSLTDTDTHSYVLLTTLGRHVNAYTPITMHFCMLCFNWTVLTEVKGTKKNISTKA